MSDTEKSAQAQSNESAEPAFRYNAKLAQGIEEKWQKIWDDEGTFWAANVNGDLKDGKGRNAEGRPSYFAMDMFPYPSGKGLHVGHPLGYLATDVVSRYHRMKGENVLHAMGYDAFGLPAEQYAVQTGQHPRITTEQNIANMRRQLHRMGLSFDNRRSFATIDPGYVRWTQWIFSRIYDSWYDEDATNPSGSKGCARPISTLVEQFESGEREIPGFAGKQWNDLTEAEQADVLNDFRLAYISKSPVNWCPGLGTVLANEEVTAEGKSERGNFPVFQRELRQWSMRITAYGHRLIEDLDGIDWPEKVKLMQRNWIGKSVGAEITFPLESGEGDIKVFTTRPDTVFGVTFMTLAPEHPLVDSLISGKPNEAEARAFIERIHNMDRIDRQSDSLEKEGVFTGAYCLNPFTGRQVPIWLGNFVLAEYGTGAVMAVPAHDQRDFDFSKKYGMERIVVIQPEGEAPLTPESLTEAYTAPGVLVNSGEFNGLHNEEAKKAIADALEASGKGKRTTNWRLRDWNISRQRYWGAPIPVIYCDKCGMVPVPEDQLPVRLPLDVQTHPDGKSPLPHSRILQLHLPEVRRRGQARNRHDGYLCGILVVLRPLYRRP